MRAPAEVVERDAGLFSSSWAAVVEEEQVIPTALPLLFGSVELLWFWHAGAVHLNFWKDTSIIALYFWIKM